MPWFYRNNPILVSPWQRGKHAKERRNNGIDVKTIQNIAILLIIFCSMHKCTGFSPHIIKHVSILHASRPDSKSVTLDVNDNVAPSIVSSNNDSVSKKHPNRNKRKGSYKKRPKLSKHWQKCSKAQNVKRRIRFLYSKAR